MTKEKNENIFFFINDKENDDCIEYIENNEFSEILEQLEKLEQLKKSEEIENNSKYFGK